MEKIPVNMKKAKISRLRNQKGSGAASVLHCINYLHVLDEVVGTADIHKLTEADLSNDGTELATGGRDTVTGRAITSGENFSRYNESSAVGAKILEEVGQAVEEDKSLLAARGGGELVVTEAYKVVNKMIMI